MKGGLRGDLKGGSQGGTKGGSQGGTKGGSQGDKPDRTYLYQLKQELKQFIDTQITPIDETFSLTQTIPVLTYSDILSQIAPETAILQWYITDERIMACILTHHHPEPLFWQSETTDKDNLVNWFIKDYLTPYLAIREAADKEETKQRQQEWENNLETSLEQLAAILHLEEVLKLIPDTCQRLILIPHRLLHLLPLHSLPVTRRGNAPVLAPSVLAPSMLLMDLYAQGVSYAPSCQLLKIAQQRQRPDFNTVLNIINPGEDLSFTSIETAKMRTLLQQTVLPKQKATKTNFIQHPHLKTTHGIHFSCHGLFEFALPLESGLQLADERLKLGAIFDLDLPQCRLVTLSACETGLSALTSYSDEYIGLPSGFIFAGSTNVVSSLWSVSELSTMILMLQFYENLLGEYADSVTLALIHAQKWMRGVTKTEFEQWVTEKQLTLDATQREYLDLWLKDAPEYPFKQAYHWAGFCAIGQ